MLRFFTRNNFRKEMSIVIILKLFLLFVLWSLFFSHHDPEQLNKNNLVNHFVDVRLA